MKKSCSSCIFWSHSDVNGNLHLCEWTPDVAIPFWARITEMEEHGNWTSATYGRYCKTYTAIDEE